MPIKPYTLYTQYHASDFFSLSVKQRMTDTKIIMKIMQGTVNTRELPHTYGLLKKHLPTVLRSTCYNEDNFPFYKEVQHTEIGHLFEHVLIEFLCLLKVEDGYDNVEVCGLTKWNWIVFPKGSFHITISAGVQDTVYFAQAMDKTIALIKMILASGQKTIAPHSPYQLRTLQNMEDPSVGSSQQLSVS